jgi:hypothetical protein
MQPVLRLSTDIRLSIVINDNHSCRNRISCGFNQTTSGDILRNRIIRSGNATTLPVDYQFVSVSHCGHLQAAQNNGDRNNGKYTEKRGHRFSGLSGKSKDNDGIKFNMQTYFLQLIIPVTAANNNMIGHLAGFARIG